LFVKSNSSVHVSPGGALQILGVRHPQSSELHQPITAYCIATAKIRLGRIPNSSPEFVTRLSFRSIERRTGLPHLHFPAANRPATPRHHRHPRIPLNPRKPNSRNHFPPIRKPETRTPESVSALVAATINQNPHSGQRLLLTSLPPRHVPSFRLPCPRAC
jgi:hypothetical protein